MNERAGLYGWRRDLGVKAGQYVGVDVRPLRIRIVRAVVVAVGGALPDARIRAAQRRIGLWVSGILRNRPAPVGRRERRGQRGYRRHCQSYHCCVSPIHYRRCRMRRLISRWDTLGPEGGDAERKREEWGRRTVHHPSNAGPDVHSWRQARICPKIVFGARPPVFVAQNSGKTSATIRVAAGTDANMWACRLATLSNPPHYAKPCTAHHTQRRSRLHHRPCTPAAPCREDLPVPCRMRAHTIQRRGRSLFGGSRDRLA